MIHALQIAGLGILVTFSGLALLALLVLSIGKFDIWRRQIFARRSQAKSDERLAGRESEKQEDPPLEVVAVISAAVEAAVGHPVQIRQVRYLRPAHEDEGAWTRIGRLQVMASHAVVRRDT